MSERGREGVLGFLVIKGMLIIDRGGGVGSWAFDEGMGVFGVLETLALRVLCPCWVCMFCWFGCCYLGTAMRGIWDYWYVARMVDDCMVRRHSD